MNSDTIVAIATGAMPSGIGIVRLSGALAYSIALKINQQKALTPRMVHFCEFYSENGQLLDQGVMIYFQSPHSFTGEDIVEIQGHGSPIVLDEMVKTCIKHGARIANPGEFSLRAFLNDKIDLTQAEAIADLIHANSQSAAKMAMRSLQGEFSKCIQRLNKQLIELRLFVEAAIDFPEEEIDFLSDGKIESLLRTAITDLTHIRNQAAQGCIIREGLSIVIAGKPNAGKSTLMNALSGKNVAIVTDVAGTTRDVMREHVLIDDIPVHLIDTAGLRDSDDIVEQEGIKRAWNEVRQADCVLFLIDVALEHDHHALEASIQAELPPNVPVIRVFNKIDKVGQSNHARDGSVYLSAQTGRGLDELKEVIKSVVGYQPQEGQFLARRRHLQALDDAFTHLQLGLDQLVHFRAGELLAEELRLAHLRLCEITGEFTTDDLLGVIFSSFCIGK